MHSVIVLFMHSFRPEMVCLILFLLLYVFWGGGNFVIYCSECTFKALRVSSIDDAGDFKKGELFSRHLCL